VTTDRRGSRFLQLLEIIYYLETGAFLVLSPWSRLWVERVVSRSPIPLQTLLVSPYFRGLVAGIGVLHLVFALRQVAVYRLPAPVGALPEPERTDA